MLAVWHILKGGFFYVYDTSEDIVIQYLSDSDPSLAKLMMACKTPATKGRTIDGKRVETDYTKEFNDFG